MDPFNEKKLYELYTACTKRNSKESIKLILEGLKDINYFARTTNSKFAGYTPLHFIVQYGQDMKLISELIELLLNRGADITIKNKNNQTPLHLACTSSRITTDIVDLIMSAHKNYAMNPINDEGLSHFHIACWRNNISVVENFLQNKVEVRVPIRSADHWPSNIPLHIAFMHKNAEVDRWLGYMPLHIALKYKNAEIVEILSQHNAFIDNTGVSRFHIACMINDKATVEKFLHKGASVNAPIDFESPVLAGYTPLHLVVEFNDYKIVELLLNFGANISLINANGETPINICKCNQKLKMIIDVVVQKYNLKNSIFPSDAELSKFLFACKENDSTQIEFFFEQDVTINNTFCLNSLIWAGYSLLHVAVEFGCDEIIKILLKKGADIALQDAIGCTPVHLATRQKNKQIVDLLLSFCSESMDNPSDKRGLSLFHIACMTDNSTVAEKFIQSGANVNDAIVLDITDIYVQNSKIRPKELFIHKNHKAGETALHFAVIRRCHDMVILLLKHGGDVLIQNADGSTPIHLAAQGNFDRDVPDDHYNSSEEDLFFSSEKDDMYILYNLIKSQKTGNINPADSDGLTHFHIACFAKLECSSKDFIKCNCDVNASVSSTSRKWAGYTPLHFALFQRVYPVEIVTLLLDNGANINAKEAQGKTALHMAVEPDLKYHFQFHEHSEDYSYECDPYYEEVVELLVNRGADINAKDKDGKTPLQHALTSKTKKLLYSLLSTNTVDKLKYIDDTRLSLIHVACMRKNFVLLKKCLQEGADANLQIDSHSPFFPGYTPLHCIVEFISSGNNFIQLLLKYKADCRIKNAYGFTPLQIAKKEEKQQFIKLLEGISHINENVDLFASE